MSTSIEALAMAGADYNEFNISFEEWERDEIMNPPPPHLLAYDDDDDEVARYFKNKNFGFSSAALSNFQKVDYEERGRDEIMKPPPTHLLATEQDDDDDDEDDARYFENINFDFSSDALSNFQKVDYDEWERDEIMKPPPTHLLATEQDDDDDDQRYFKNKNYGFSSTSISNFQKVDYEEWKRNKMVEPPPPHDPKAEDVDDDEVTLSFKNTTYGGYPSSAAATGRNFQNQAKVSHLDEKSTLEAMMVAIMLKIFKWLYKNVILFVANLVCIALFPALN